MQHPRASKTTADLPSEPKTLKAKPLLHGNPETVRVQGSGFRV